MGFGLLFLGYMFSYIIRIGLGNYAFAAMLIGSFIMYLGLSELRKYSPVFIYSYVLDILLILCAFFESIRGIDEIFMLSWGIHGSTAAAIFEWAGVILDLLFNAAVIYGIIDMAKRVDFPDIRSRAIRNSVFVGIFYTYQFFIMLPIEAVEKEKSFLMTLLVLASVVYTVLNAALIFRCYALICPEGDVEMKRKPSRFAFINKLNEKTDEREARATESAIKYYEEKARQKKEKRESKYQSNHVKYNNNRKKRRRK